MRVMKNEKGFTLIELVLIIVVLGILSAVALNQFGNLSISARDGTIDGAYGSYQSAVAIALGECRSLPTRADQAVDGNCDPVGTDTAGDFTVMVNGRVDLTSDLSSNYVPATGVLTICSGTIAGGGRMAQATYLETANPPLGVLGAKVAAAAPCPA